MRAKLNRKPVHNNIEDEEQHNFVQAERGGEWKLGNISV